MSRYYKFAIFFAIFSAVSANYAYSPVILWDSQSVEELPAISALQKIDYETLMKDYIPAFEASNIVLFMQDVLSAEDFSNYPKSFKYMGQVFEGSHTLYVPSLESPSDLLDKPLKDGYHVQTINPGSSISGLELKGKKNLIVINLPDTLKYKDESGEQNRAMALRKADEIIEGVLGKIGGLLKNYAVIYTGRTSPFASSSREKGRIHKRVARQASDDQNLQFYEWKCPNDEWVYLYVRRQITLSMQQEGNKFVTGNVPKNTSNDVTGECMDFHRSITLRFKNFQLGEGDDKITIDKFRVEFDFFKNMQSWSLLNGTVDVTTGGSVYSGVIVPDDVAKVPLGYSYTSYEVKLSTTSDAAKTIKIVIDGVQYQAFEVVNERFSKAFDSVGFFTIPILTGLLATLIALAILIWGFSMLADVKTMDRFDDPKGKTITVPNTE